MNDVTPLFSDRVYNRVRQLAEFVLPATATLYFALAAIWGLPYADEVVGTIAAVNAFAGALVMIGRRKYNESDAGYDGEFQLKQYPDGEPAGMKVVADKPLEEMDSKGEVRLKVTRPVADEE